MQVPRPLQKSQCGWKVGPPWCKWTQIRGWSGQACIPLAFRALVRNWNFKPNLIGRKLLGWRLVVKNLPEDSGDKRDTGSVPRLGRSPGGGHGNPLQYSCLENPMDRGAWWATVHGVTKRTWLRQLGMHAWIDGLLSGIPRLLCGEPELGGRGESRETGEAGAGPLRVVAAPEKRRDVMWPWVGLAVWDSWPMVRGALNKDGLVWWLPSYMYSKWDCFNFFLFVCLF